MNVLMDLDHIPVVEGTIATIGAFDGIHLGHKKILQEMVQKGRSLGLESVVVTFWPHPRLVLSSMSEPQFLLSTLEEKLASIQALGIDHVLVIPFTKEFSEQSSHAFIESILVKKLNVKRLVIGYDHKFGKNREGDFAYLKKNEDIFGFKVEEIPQQKVDEMGISSTEIRKFLLEGEVEKAASLLGEPYVLRGTVVKGRQLGRTIGFPTANISVVETHKLLPAQGVYAVEVNLGELGKKFGMLNLGVKPTVDGKTLSLEVHIFDFNADIYGQEIVVMFKKRLRPEMKFDGLPALQAQLEQDKHQALSILLGQ